MSRKPPPIPARAWVVLFLAGMAGMFFYVDRQTLSVLKTTLRAAMAWTDGDYGRLVAAFMAPYTLCYLVTGPLIDRWGTRVMMAAFLGSMSLAMVGSGLSEGLGSFGASRFLLGMAEAGITPAVMVAIVRWFPPELRGTATTLNKPLTVAGQILVVPYAAWVALHYGWRWAFVLPGIVGLAFALAWWLADFGSPAELVLAPAGGFRRYPEIIRKREIRGVLLARVISDPLWFFLMFWQPGFLQERFGLSLGKLGRLGWIPAALSLLGIMALGYASDILVRRGIAPIRSRVLVLVASAAASPLLLVLARTSSLPAAIGLLAILQTMNATWLSLSGLLMGELVPAGMVGTTVAIVSALGAAMGALFNLAAGRLVESFGYNTLLTAGALLHPLAALVLWRSYLRRPAAAPAPGIPAEGR